MTGLTDKQSEVHEFLCSRWNDPPTVREMAAHFGVGANAIVGHLKALSKKGYIKLPDG